MSHTPGPWKDGEMGASIVSDSPEGYVWDEGSVRAYGGFLIAESIAPCNKPLIKAAPDLLAVAKRAAAVMNLYGNITNWPMEMPHEYADVINDLRAAIARAEVAAEGAPCSA